MQEKVALNDSRTHAFAPSPILKEASLSSAVSPSSRLSRRSSEAISRRISRRTVTLDSIDRGLVTASLTPGLTYIDQPGSYAIGEGFFSRNLGARTGDIFRNFFSFQLPRLRRGERVVGATLQVTRFNSSAGDLVETLGLFDISTPFGTLNSTLVNVPNPALFADLGTGKSYGLFSVSTFGSPSELLSFRLNSTAVGEINRPRSRVFSIGGSIQSLNDTGTPIAENLFTLGDSSGVVRLVLQVQGR